MNLQATRFLPRHTSTALANAAVMPPSLRILVPVDFSNASEAAMRYAITLAEKFSGQIVLVHAVEPVPYALSMAAMTGTFLVERNETDLHKFADQFSKPHLIRDVCAHIGPAFEVIIEAARQFEADLIILSIHRAHGLRHLLTGDTVSKVVREAPCSVLVTRPKNHSYGDHDLFGKPLNA